MNEWLIPAAGVLALVFAFIKAGWVNGQSPGNEKMVEIGQAVREGAMAFLAREYRALAVFVVIVAIVSSFASNAPASAPRNKLNHSVPLHNQLHGYGPAAGGGGGMRRSPGLQLVLTFSGCPRRRCCTGRTATELPTHSLHHGVPPLGLVCRKERQAYTLRPIPVET